MHRRQFLKRLAAIPAAWFAGTAIGRSLVGDGPKKVDLVYKTPYSPDDGEFIGFTDLDVGREVTVTGTWNYRTPKEEFMADHMLRGLKETVNSLPFTPVK